MIKLEIVTEVEHQKQVIDGWREFAARSSNRWLFRTLRQIEAAPPQLFCDLCGSQVPAVLRIRENYEAREGDEQWTETNLCGECLSQWMDKLKSA